MLVDAQETSVIQCVSCGGSVAIAPAKPAAILIAEPIPDEPAPPDPRPQSLADSLSELGNAAADPALRSRNTVTAMKMANQQLHRNRNVALVFAGIAVITFVGLAVFWSSTHPLLEITDDRGNIVYSGRHSPEDAAVIKKEYIEKSKKNAALVKSERVIVNVSSSGPAKPDL